MPRMHLLEQWFAFADLEMEAVLDDIPVMRAFAGIDTGHVRIQDGSSKLGFRHLLEARALAQAMPAETNTILEHRVLISHHGTLMDATLAATLGSIKNADGQRDPMTQQTETSNRSPVSQKARIDVASHSGLVHSVLEIAASVNDTTHAPALPHGQEINTHAGARYQGTDNRPRPAVR